MGGRIINMEVNSICLESVTSLRLWSFVCADVYWGHPFSGNGGGVGCAQTRSGTLTTRESNSDVPVQGILGAAFESREERVGCNCALYSPLLSCCCGWSSWGPGGLGMFQVSLPAFVALAWRAMWARQVCMLGRRLSQAGLGHQGWVTSPPPHLLGGSHLKLSASNCLPTPYSSPPLHPWQFGSGSRSTHSFPDRTSDPLHQCAEWGRANPRVPVMEATWPGD